MNDFPTEKEMLSFEWDAKDERLEIHASRSGLERLIQRLNALLESTPPEHTHMMTEKWGGTDLTSEKQNEDATMINHVKIIRWK